MNKKIKKELKKSFNPPPLNENLKSDFLINLDHKKLNELEIFFVQIKYIRKRFWLLSAMIVTLAFLALNFNEGTYSKTLSLSSILPFLTLASITEINKSLSYNMYELEMSCKYNLQRLTVIQMSIIGTVHFLLMLILLVVCNNSTKLGLGLTIVYCISPYLLVNYLSLFIINNIKSKDNVYICSGVVFFVSIFVFNVVKRPWIINTNAVKVLLGLLLVLIILLTKEFITLIKRREELQCHLELMV